MKRTKKTTARLKKDEKILGSGAEKDHQAQVIPAHIVRKALKRKTSSNRKKRK